MVLTSKERIERVFQNQEIDRPVVKLWGAGLNAKDVLHADYLPVSHLASETTDLFESFEFPFNIYAGRNIEQYRESYVTDTRSPDWKNAHTIFHTPKGNLHMIERISTKGDPGYIVEHMIKEPEDIEKLLSMKYDPFLFDNRSGYDDAVSRMGDRGIVMIGLDHAGYAVHRMLGSETLAYFCYDEREALHHLVEVYAQRLREHTKAILSLGLPLPVFNWVGPELFQPPLVGPSVFNEFIHDMDKPLADIIHNANGYVWVHSHGKVAKLLDSFIDMGVDVLNPLEPGKNGDINLADAVTKYGNRIGWEGNIEIQDILLSSEEHLRYLIDECVREGWKSGRFILCQSAGYMEYPRPTEHYISNLIFYLRHGLEAAEQCR